MRAFCQRESIERIHLSSFGFQLLLMFLRLSERVESIVGSDFAVDFGESSGAKRELWRATVDEKQRPRAAIDQQRN